MAGLGGAGVRGKSRQPSDVLDGGETKRAVAGLFIRCRRWRPQEEESEGDGVKLGMRMVGVVTSPKR